MLPGGAAALAAIRRAFGEPVIYAGAGLDAELIDAIWSDSPGPPFQGPGDTIRTVTAEIDKGDLPQRPAKADRITRGGVIWRPIEINDRDDVSAWVLTLEALP